MVEFALVLPMLIVLFLGIADFGRVFQAGITVEGIARNAAEIVAGDTRLDNLKDLSGCDPACRSQLYQQLHELAATTACDEAKRLDHTTDVGGTCADLLIVGACIHDADTAPPGDDSCGVITGGTLPTGCSELAPGSWSNAQNGVTDIPGATPELRYVEVRVCYRFTPLFDQIGLPIVSYLVPNQIYLERTRYFTVSSDY
jgi:hypothetical protein